MSEVWKLRVLWGVAAALLVAGAVLSAVSVSLASDTRARLARKQAELGRLAALEARIRSYDEARRTVSAAMPADGRPADLTTLLAARTPPLRPEETNEKRDAIGEGWTRVRRTLTFGNAPPAGVMAFMRDAEARRPRWRVVQCTINALPSQGGAGRITLELESLQGPARQVP